jgi:outer membrane protein OmpA-like peptidoglycan-associated protein
VRAVRVAVESTDTSRAGSAFSQLGNQDNDKPLTQIYFSAGNFWLGPNGKLVLERTLPKLLEDKRPILIVGGADPSGGEEVNEKLSDARTQSVAQWMVAHGVEASRIERRGIGLAGAVGSSLDRRVDIWLGGSR